MHKNKKIESMLVVAVVAFGVGFWGGTMYKGSGTANQAGRAFQNGALAGGRTQNGAGMRGGFGGGAVAGSIMAKDDTSITVKLRDGGSKIVFLSGTTKISKSTDGVADDLKVGEEVVVMGTASTDGSVAAQTIQIRPALSASSTRSQ